MSNVCPRAACLNEGAWQGFEKIESEDYGQRFKRTWAITGPVFDSNPDTIVCEVQVPKVFYKIVVMNDDGHPASIAIEMTPAPPRAGSYIRHDRETHRGRDRR